MGKQINVDEEVTFLLDNLKAELKKENRLDSYSNAIRLLATKEPMDIRIKG